MGAESIIDSLLQGKFFPSGTTATKVPRTKNFKHYKKEQTQGLPVQNPGKGAVHCCMHLDGAQLLLGGSKAI